MVTATLISDNLALEEFMANPPDNMEWVDGQIVEKNGATLKHGKIQSRLGCSWANYMIFSKQGGEVYISPPCCTNQQIRRPDVAYLTSGDTASTQQIPIGFSIDVDRLLA
jgi:Uma2 family endonuclease